MSYWNHLLANFKIKINKTQEDKMNQNNELESYNRIIKRTIIVCFLTKTFFSNNELCYYHLRCPKRTDSPIAALSSRVFYWAALSILKISKSNTRNTSIQVGGIWGCPGQKGKPGFTGVSFKSYAVVNWGCYNLYR